METGIYIHIPFCIAKCRYCSFFSVRHNEDLIEPYVDALTREIDHRGREIAGCQVKSIYLGGGTPTILKSRHISKILNRCRDNFNFLDDIEISIEGNPKTVNKDYLLELINLGVNRLTIGIQSFNDNELTILGRAHDSVEGIAAFEDARRAGFKNIGIDLIYGIPYQKERDWDYSLNRAIGLSPEHISIYSLSIEKGTLFDKYHREKRLIPLPEDEHAKMYDNAYTGLKNAGYIPYEISNFSMPGHESRHNQIYWNNEEYIGFGASAYSYLNGKRYWSVSDVNKYIDSINACGDAVSGSEALGRKELWAEAIMLGLRKWEGIDINKLNQRFNIDFAGLYKGKVARLINLGLIDLINNHLKITNRGALVLNEVILEFI
ncbi:MAG: radical SAM family heme chaperone HemW [Nitrospirae bacterium]|nr:radical SAM family heme chaperone HemW [Nitrospirota bacterium]